jgi:phosphopentomutase
LDSAGIGELPDAREYGDVGANTLINIKRACPDLKLPNLCSLGLSNISGASELSDKPVTDPKGSFGKMASRSKGKDTTIGHWELAGVWQETPLPTFPQGFPAEVVGEFEARCGYKTIGNYTSSGTEILKQLGAEHVKTGKLIIYTSIDSVFQIAMHEDLIPIEEQYRISQIARDVLKEPYNVGRVITRPFVGTEGDFRRTANRRDFSLPPPAPTMLDFIKNAGLTVTAVGKIEDIYCGRGITDAVHTKNNGDGVDKTLEYLSAAKDGLIFTNLVDFDMVYGHRNDAAGYTEALMAFDRRLPEILDALRDGDLLIITADHGCDPTMPGTDHSREYAPLLVYGKRVKSGVDLGIRETFADVGATVLDWLGVEGNIKGGVINVRI